MKGMTSFVKTAGLAGILVFATVTPDLKAAQPNSAVREGQATATDETSAAARLDDALARLSRRLLRLSHEGFDPFSILC